jgi:hypothetical protein
MAGEKLVAALVGLAGRPHHEDVGVVRGERRRIAQ